MSVSLSPKLLADFAHLAENVSLYTPSGASEAPSDMLIVSCTWMGAATKHISKYTDGYKILFPSASVLLIRNYLPDMLGGRKADRRLEPAISVIRRHARPENDSAPPNILIHSFSNGGANQLIHLSSLFKNIEGRPIPARAIVFDSSPGAATWRRSYTAIRIGLPNNIFFKIFGGLLVHTLILCVAIFHILMRTEDKITINNRLLNDSSTIDQRARRVYTYSEADVMVWFSDVERHAAEAKAKGWKVQTVRFKSSPHAAHLLEDKDRYWKAVGNVWSGS